VINREQREIIIFGSGGQARETAEVASLLGWDVLAFASLKAGPSIGGIPVVSENQEPRAKFAAVAIGEGGLRARVMAGQAHRYKFPALVHRDATVADSAELSAGCFVQAGVVISTSARLGVGCLVNYGATIGHDAELAAFSTVLPNAAVSGHVAIGQEAMIGAGAVILPGLTVGNRSRVGAGAVVTKNVEDEATVVGIPARKVSEWRD
jgi:sugar O-acyltransferase (sialic acid O-acetyltransferase NeuD family)